MLRRPLRAALYLGPALLAAACASEATVTPAAAPAPSPSSPPPSAPIAAATPVAPAPAGPVSFDDERRALLAQMVATDTSHGHETALLEPIAGLYRAAGVPVQILESSPGRGNLVARLKGTGTKKPLLLLAHVDVVPVEGQPWTVPAFALTEKEQHLWGRGVNDDKGMAAAVVALTLELARAKTPLSRDVIVALTAGEETGGDAGARWLVANHRDLIDAEVALNEGGGELLADDESKVVTVNFGVSEKTYQTFDLVVKGTGGHSSQPPTTKDPVVTMARALEKIGTYRFPAKVLPEAKAEFEAQLASAEPQLVPALKHAIASAPRLAPADDLLLAKSAAYNAQLRTTCVTTMLKGSPQDNVLPTTVEAKVNCRILPGETVAQTKAALVKVVGDAEVGLTEQDERGGGPPSPYDGEVLAAVKQAASKAFPGAAVSPYMIAGATDSRFLRAVGMRAYGVSPVTSTRPEAKAGHGAHGADERASSRWSAPAAAYFRDVVRTLAL